MYLVKYRIAGAGAEAGGGEGVRDDPGNKEVTWNNYWLLGVGRWIDG
jgi:hypothetical protein